MWNKAIVGMSVAASLVASTAIQAQVENPFSLRARYLVVSPVDSSDPISTINGTATVDSDITPELDFSYFFTENVAVELIAAVSRHRVVANNTVAGKLNLGEVSLLPPTLTAQWHFLPDNLFAPYVGAGLNYTHFYGVNSGQLTSVEYKDSFGAALQAGANFNFTKNWHLNLDVKKVYIDTDVKIKNAADDVFKTKLDISPWIIGVGIGYRFS